MRLPKLMVVLAGVLAAGVAAAEEPTLQNVPPVVVTTVPAAGATGVSAGATEIRVTFSKKMRPASWSWSKASDASFPKMTGQPSYAADQKTCVLPVNLEAGKTYAIWLNLSPAENFTDEDGRKALPYLLTFSTR